MLMVDSLGKSSLEEENDLVAVLESIRMVK